MISRFSLHLQRGERHRRRASDSFACDGGTARVLAQAGRGSRAICATPAGQEPVGRKFLIAGKGGLNLTHSEPLPAFRRALSRRAPEVGRLAGRLRRRRPARLGARRWASTPSSAAPAACSRTTSRRRRCCAAGCGGCAKQACASTCSTAGPGWGDDGALRFDTPDGERRCRRRRQRAGAGRRQLAGTGLGRRLGGRRWPQPASTSRRCKPANCGFDVGWSDALRQPPRRRADQAGGRPLARRRGRRALRARANAWSRAHGIEGSLVYALSARAARADRPRTARRTLPLDLVPGRDASACRRDLARPRNGRSLGEHLRRQRRPRTASRRRCCTKCWARTAWPTPRALAARDQAPAADAAAPAPDRRGHQQRRRRAPGGAGRAPDAARPPGVFCAGEMLDWEAPTGGYLLTACFASRGSRPNRSAASPGGRCRCPGRRSAACRLPARGCSRRRSAWPRRRRRPSPSTWAWKRAAWSSGSFNSEKPLAISLPPTNSSKRSVMPGSVSLSRASGDDLDRVVGDEGRLDQRVLDGLLEDLQQQLAPAVARLDLRMPRRWQCAAIASRSRSSARRISGVVFQHRVVHAPAAERRAEVDRRAPSHSSCVVPSTLPARCRGSSPRSGPSSRCRWRRPRTAPAW